MGDETAERTSTATEFFSKGYNCAQSVLYAFRDEGGGLEEETALKIACGLGAGMARKEEVCGAVTGGILVLGMRHGRGIDGDRSAMELTYRKTRELMDLFAARQGSWICRQLLGGIDLTTEEGQRDFKSRNLLNTLCKGCVQSVVEILQEIR
jgi:C_GCAxxG_C_C family probable redox protein